jgi:hypothetical protein
MLIATIPQKMLSMIQKTLEENHPMGNLLIGINIRILRL